jgi:filamentous hemagglutinin family protein
MAAAFMSAEHALAQPTGAQAIAGQAQLRQQGNTLVVTTQNAAGTNRSVINWQSFSIPSGSVTRFDQPTAQSLSINRVVGNDPSQIYGTLSSNGRLVLVNPFGITVGAGAVVDTAGFTASTLRMSDADALAGRLRFTNDGTAGPLVVNGNVVSRGGDVVLIAPNVQVGSQAVVQAQDGAAVLAAGQTVEITGRGLEGIMMEVQAPQDSAVNLGTLKGDAVGIFAGTLKHSGLVQANAATVEGGKVVLKARGDAIVDGQISAQAGNKGGSIDVLGNRVGLMAGATIDASGAAGGGTVRIGGDFHGANAGVPNAQRTYVDPTAAIHADATQNGDGGKIAVWADNQTQGFGLITARGGSQGGNGGFVEVSGKQTLQFGAHVDTRAPKGKMGTLLLDPNDITIDSPGSLPYSGPVAFGDVPDPMSIDATSISNATSNVDLQATNSITFNAGVSMANSGVGLSAVAGGNITVNAPITTKGGAIYLSAGDSSAGTLAPSSGALYVQANLDTTAGGTVASGANITLKSRLSDAGGNSVYINGVTINGGSAGAVQAQGQRVDVLTAGIVGGSISVRATAGDVNLDTATVSVNAGTGGISLSSDSAATTVSASTLQTANGTISINAGQVTPSSGNAVTISGSTVNAGTGSVQINGQALSGVGVSLNGATISGADVTVMGSTSLGSGSDGVDITGFSTLTGSHSVNVSGINGGLYVSDATITAGSGGMSLGSTGVGLYMDFSTLTANNGPIAIAGVDPTYGSTGVAIYNSTIQAGTGSVTISGQAPAGGVGTSLNTLSINGGSVTITGASSLGSGYDALDINSSTLTGSNSLQIGGGDGNVSVTSSTLTAGASGLAVIGSGLFMTVGINSSTLSTSGAAFIGSNDGYVDFYSSTLTAAAGASFVSPTGYVSLSSSDVNVSAGNALMYANSIALYGSALTTGGGSVSMAAGAGSLTIYSSSVNSNGGNVSLTGGNVASGGTGVETYAADIQAGAGNITITGYGQYDGVSLGNSTLGGGVIAISGTNNPSAGPPALAATAISSSGPAVTVSGTTLSGGSAVSISGGVGGLYVSNALINTGGGQLTLSADSMAFYSSTLSSGAGRTVLTPFSSGRGIWIGGVDDGTHLTLDPKVLESITAGTLVIGGAAYDGGIDVLSSLTLTNAPALSLVQARDATGYVNQASGAFLNVANLNASAGSVNLGDANVVGTLSGGAGAGGFNFNNTGSGLTIGTVDGTSGIQASGGTILVKTPGLLTLTQPVISDAAAGSNAITLVADDLSTSGAGTLQATNDRWAVFLQAPTANLAGSPVSGNYAVWGRTFSGSTSASLSETGNRYVFAYQPQVTITANPATKGYDGTDIFPGLTATVTGIPDPSLYGNVFTKDVVGVVLNPSIGFTNVGTYADSIKLLQATLPSGYSGYTFVPGTATIAPSTGAAQQMNNQVVTFLTLFVQQAAPQDPNDKPKGEPDIVVTGTSCKPS